jgi:GT2 family glycosyltransferase
VSEVSVAAIVVAYNSRATIESCLRALRSTRYRTFDILVVDNASVDGTRAVVERSGIEVVDAGANRGFAGGVNLGIRHFESDHGGASVYALVNPDCVVEPGWVGAFLVELLANEATAVVGARLSGHDPTDGLQHAGATIAVNGFTEHVGRGSRDAAAHRQRAEVDYVTGALCAFRRDTWLVHGPLDDDFHPAYFEEVDFCVRCRKAGGKVVFVPEAEATHTEAAVLGVGTRRYLHAYHRGRMRFLVKHSLVRGRARSVFRSELAWLLRQRRWKDVAPVLGAYMRVPAMLFEKHVRGTAKTR